MSIREDPPTSSTEHSRLHRRSIESLGSHIHWDEDNTEDHGNGHSPNREAGSPSRFDALTRRRSSLTLGLTALGDAGGVNSINNFARSWQRAAGFTEVTTLRPSFRIASEGEYPREGLTVPDHRSLLRQALHADGRRSSDQALAVDEGGPHEETHLLSAGVEARLGHTRTHYDESIFSIEPSLSSPFGGSYGTNYSSLAHVNESSMRHAGHLFREQQSKGVGEPEQQREPLLVKQIEEDGRVISVVVGQSTLPQTIFNSVNVLVGVGLLTLPLAFKYSGWLIGVIFFILSAITTSYTAKLLAKCLDFDSSLLTFADLAYVSFGNTARIAVSILFSLELLAACVALVVLFADSMNDLIPGWGVLGWKLVCGVILTPLAFMPLRWLSFTSILGVMSCFGITIAIWVDGLIKTEQPGSLHQPATQYIFPKRWTTVPLAIGLLMSPWGGHSVFPNIYRDMRHPHKYRKGVNITYVFTFLADLGMACAGILMFGDYVHDEITSNIFITSGYPRALSVFIAICIAIIPLTKVPLNARPIIATLEVVLGLDPRSLAASSSLNGMSGLSRGILKFSLRIIVVALLVIIAIVLPSFDRIMTLMGSVACFSICIILPLAFHLKLFGHELGQTEKVLNWVLIVVSTILAFISTGFALVPKELIGAD